MRNPANGSKVMVATAKPVPQVHRQLQALQRPFHHVQKFHYASFSSHQILASQHARTLLGVYPPQRHCA